MSFQRLLISIAVIIGAYAASQRAYAQTTTTVTETETITVTTIETDGETSDNTSEETSVPPSIFGGKAEDALLGHFSWGADLGTGIDLTANDMTFLDLHAYLGYKGHALRFLGVGAGVNTMMNNSSRCYPVYAMLRTSFSSRPRLCFMDLRLGISFNHLYDSADQTGFYGSIGLGITLATGRRFSSHIIAGYTFRPVSSSKIPENPRLPDLHFAALRIGCAF